MQKFCAILFFVKMLTLPLILGILGLHQCLEPVNARDIYHFSKPEDKEACSKSKFVAVSASRRASTIHMTRKSADSCCKMRGMTLYTAERTDEPKTFSKQMQEKIKGNKEILHWVSANSFKEKDKFVWEFGKGVGEEDCRSYKWDNHTWDEGEPGKGRCTVIKAGKGKLLLKTAKCEKETHPFICEMEPKTGGNDLTVKQLMNCMGSNFTDVPGYPYLKIFESLGTWRTATMCCQTKGWALVDNIAHKGKQFYDTVASHPWGPGIAKNLLYWTSGNDFVEFRQWKWGCGDPAEQLEWYMEESTNTTSPDNKMGNENCLAYTDKNTEKGFGGEDYDCNEIGSIICDTNPRCGLEEQYEMGSKEPRKYDMLDSFEDDMAKCKSVTFKAPKIDRSNPELQNFDEIISVGDKKMSWMAAMKCCEDRGMQALSLNKREGKYVLDRIMFEDAINGERGWDPRKVYWVSASNTKGSSRSEMKWSDGTPVKSTMMDPTKIHDDIHPVCGQLGYIPPRGFFVHTANCLDKNYIVCSKRNSSLPKTAKLEVPSAVEDAALYNQTLVFPTEEELAHQLVDVNRDRCPVSDFEFAYNNSCPGSAINGETIKGSTTPTNLTEDIKYKINSQNKRILHVAIQDGIFGYRVPDHPPNYSFKLLEISTDILAKLCPIVPPKFIQDVYQFFQEIHWTTSQGRTDVLKKSDYKWILKLIEACSIGVKPLRVRTDNCGDQFISVDNCTDFICTKSLYESKMSRVDPLVDVMWKSFEMAHAYCFPFFEESYRMFHSYGRTISDLWSYEIRLRWFSQLASHDYWVRVLGPHYATNLLNLERCTEASTSRAFLHVRLPRSTIPDRTRLVDEKEFRKPTKI